MTSKQSINNIEHLYRFYTFTQLSDHSLKITRVPEPKLRHNINNLKQQNPKLNEEELAWHFLNKLLYGSAEAEVVEHLKAFLGSFSDVVVNKLKYHLQCMGKNDYEIFEILQDATIIAYTELEPKTFFKNFNNTITQYREVGGNNYNSTSRHQTEEINIFKDTLVPWYCSLKKYIQKRMYGKVRDILIRQEKLNKTINRTNLGLSARATRGLVLNALTSKGLTKTQIKEKVSAWQCFQEVNKAIIINTNSPSLDHLKEIAQRYNHLNSAQVSCEIIKEWLEEIGRAIRDYKSPISIMKSLDTSLFLEDNISSSLIEKLPNLCNIEDVNRLSIEEYEENFKILLSEEIKKISTDDRSVLLLKHGLQLVQEEIAIEIGKNTSNVSRRYNKILNSLIAKIIEWVNKHRDVDITERYLDPTLEQLKEIKDSLKEFLQEYYFNIIVILFNKTYSSLPDESKKNIKFDYYESALANEMLYQAYTLWQSGVIQEIKKHYSLNIKPDEPAWLQLKNEKFIKQILVYIEKDKN